MIVLHVQVQVKPECVEAFREATIRNASESVKEKGIARFDVVRGKEDPCHFVLVEAYLNQEAVDAHKKTAHYAVWREAVAPMMAAPRQGVFHESVFPEDAAW